MSIGYLQVERADTNVPLEVLVSDKNGGVTGLTLVVAIRDGDTANSWLDFFDSTFKTVGWTTRQAAMAEVSAANAPGVYRLEVDLSAVSIPAGTHFLVAEYDASGAKSANGLDIIQLRDSVYSGVNVASLDANAVNSSVIATDAIDAGALATDAVNEIRDAILSDSTPFAGANIDAAISSRAAPGAAMDLVTDALDAAALATSAVNEFADGLLARPISNVESAAFRTLYGAIAKLVNRVAVVGATLTVYETDDTTAVATQTVTSDAAADPITELNTV